MLPNDLHDIRGVEYQHLLDTFAHNIKYLRRRAKMNLPELAEASGLSLHILEKIEAAEVEPSLYGLYRIAKGLDTSLMILVAG